MKLVLKNLFVINFIMIVTVILISIGSVHMTNPIWFVLWYAASSTAQLLIYKSHIESNQGE